MKEKIERDADTERLLKLLEDRLVDPTSKRSLRMVVEGEYRRGELNGLWEAERIMTEERTK